MNSLFKAARDAEEAMAAARGSADEEAPGPAGASRTLNPKSAHAQGPNTVFRESGDEAARVRESLRAALLGNPAQRDAAHRGLDMFVRDYCLDHSMVLCGPPVVTDDPEVLYVCAGHVPLYRVDVLGPGDPRQILGGRIRAASLVLPRDEFGKLRATVFGDLPEVEVTRLKLIEHEVAQLVDVRSEAEEMARLGRLRRLVQPKALAATVNVPADELAALRALARVVRQHTTAAGVGQLPAHAHMMMRQALEGVPEA